MNHEKPLWIPDSGRVESAQITAFRRAANERHSLSLKNYAELHAWSVREPGAFWDLVWDFCGVIGDKGIRHLIDGDRMPGAQFFPDAKLNYAENLMRRHDSGTAIVFRGEDKAMRRFSHTELDELVSRLQQALHAAGIGKGDRVAAMLPNLPEAAALLLATSSIGAIFSSCSPDFGERGVVDRFGQIEPKLFFVCDGYWYNGKRIPLADKVKAVVGKIPSIGKVVVVPYLDDTDAAQAVPHGVSLGDFLKGFSPHALRFERLPFNHPLYILYSSGTTGVPKCIVHGAGGSLLQHLKEHRLHCGIGAGDKVFYFTTCGWMMWNWLASALACEATLMLYDGSPFHPDGNVLFDYARAERFTFFGTSAKFIDTLRKPGLRPIDTHDLPSMRTLASTGSPLSPEGFAFVYEGIKADIHLASISGGTDIMCCFVLGIPTKPVWTGEIQGPGLGMAVDVWDDGGKPVREEKGELVCHKAFPSMPLGFWNDEDGSRYRAAYFERFDNVWCHGDFAEWTEHGGIIIHGRSDATLNPGGVRIGTAEIYNQVERMEEVAEAICIGQDFDNDVRVVLFVRLAPGVTLDEDLQKRIKARIRTGASPRHVPAKVVQVADIPRTKSGKITELAVRDVVHGRVVKNKEALANPEALEFFKDRPELAD